jgi:selenide,water dikinase
MRRPAPLVRDLVLVGGGHAHALVLRSWGMDPLPGVRLTLINPGPAAPYTGMLPGLVAGHYRRENLLIDLDRLARHAGARLILGAAEGIDRAAGLIRVAGRPPVAYDIASLDIGVAADLPDLPGFAAHAVAARPLAAFAASWEGFAAAVAAGRAAPKVAVIGGGVAGVELALACAHRLGAGARVTVIERAVTLLPGLGAMARARLIAAAGRAGVALCTGIAPRAVTAAGVLLEGGGTVPAAFVIGAAGARPQPWLGVTGLALSRGFVDVGPTLQSSDPAIFAAGDCAHLAFAPRPKAGVYAVRQAPVLYANLRAAATGGALRRYRPQRDYLRLVSTGGRRAVADRGGIAFAGAWVWRLKDRIDRRFMCRFRDLPAMAPPGEAPPCGGCGAKSGRGRSPRRWPCCRRRSGPTCSPGPATMPRCCATARACRCSPPTICARWWTTPGRWPASPRCMPWAMSAPWRQRRRPRCFRWYCRRFRPRSGRARWPRSSPVPRPNCAPPAPISSAVTRPRAPR